MDHYNFATMITIKDSGPIVSHLPFIYRPEHSILCAHMARANPQWRTFNLEQEVLVIFHGPHAYISPRWYEPRPDNVPTWNYVVIHAHGIPKIIHDEVRAFEIMTSLVKRHDSAWQFSLLEQVRKKDMEEIVVFEIELTKLEAKFKLSQNRLEVERDKVASSLLESKDQVERETGDMMKKVGVKLR